MRERCVFNRQVRSSSFDSQVTKPPTTTTTIITRNPTVHSVTLDEPFGGVVIDSEAVPRRD